MSTLEDFMQVDFKVSNVMYTAKVWVAEDDNDLYYQITFNPIRHSGQERMIFIKEDDDLNWIQKPETHIDDRVDRAAVDAIGLEIDDYK